MSKKSVVIINPYKSAGFSYSYISNQLGLGVIALWTSRELEDHWKLYVDYRYIDTTIYSTDLDIDDYQKIVIDNNVLAFIPADDSGFSLSDKLQYAFFPEKANNPQLQSIRDNKYSYLEHLKESGVVKTFQMLPGDESIPDFDTRMILKPINGAGNEHVYVVNNKSDVEKILLNQDNITFTLQEFINGDEYCVELCSQGDIHKCTTIMKYGRQYLVNDISPWRYDNELIDSRDPIINTLVDYAKLVITNLGIRVGLTWVQIKITNGQPHLIECNFRSQGHGHLAAVLRSTNTSYAGEALRAYIGSKEKFVDSPMMYNKFAEFRKLSVNNRKDRVIDSIDFSPISTLKSVLNVWQNNFVYPGYARKTTGFKNNLAMIILCNENTEEYLSDIEKITEWQSTVEGTDEIFKCK